MYVGDVFVDEYKSIDGYKFEVQVINVESRNVISQEYETRI